MTTKRNLFPQSHQPDISYCLHITSQEMMDAIKYLTVRFFVGKLQEKEPISCTFNGTSGLCSSRAQWPLEPNFCPRATRKSQIFHTNHTLGILDFTVSEHPLGSLQFSLEHSLVSPSRTLHSFNCCKCTVNMNKSQTRTFSQLFHTHKMHLLALWAFLQTEMTDFLTLSYTSTSEIPTLKPDRGTSFGRSLLV